MTANPTLEAFRAASDAAYAHFNATIARLFPGADEWTWYRAIDHMAGGSCRRNDDTSRDAELNASTEIQAAHDAYVAALHAFYSARDGANGVLGRYAARLGEPGR